MYIKLATKYFIRTVILGLFLICFSATEAQLQYNFERINTDNGLPTNAIKGLQFDEKNRFLWIATESGIVRYNGHDIQSFGESEQSKILDGRIVFFDKTHNTTITKITIIIRLNELLLVKSESESEFIYI
jgi:ligand-binding sensor domain-containing protein